jgi:hypothetical protein
MRGVFCYFVNVTSTRLLSALVPCSHLFLRTAALKSQPVRWSRAAAELAWTNRTPAGRKSTTMPKGWDNRHLCASCMELAPLAELSAEHHPLMKAPGREVAYIYDSQKGLVD